MIDQVKHPGSEKFSPAEAIGKAMSRYILEHPDFYLFSPDETTSNKLSEVYEATARAWNLPTATWDLPESAHGQIIELLSENALFACMVGHLMNGEPAAMTSYESFFTIITSQIIQHLKFLQQSAEIDWRTDIPAANLLSTSTCWRQDHNGFTHQSPVLISTLLSHPSHLANCLFPLDDVAAEAAFIYMINSKNVVNLTTFNKVALPRWIDSHQADAEFSNGGASILEFASETDPDYIFVGCGDITATEAIRAVEILRQDLPEKHYRVVNISALSFHAIGTTERPLEQSEFDDIFTKNKPIIANFHGYPDALKQILSCYTDIRRVKAHGFMERGSTTTPFEMLNLNQATRYHLALDVARSEKRDDLIKKYQKILRDNSTYASEHGEDQAKLWN